MIDDWRLAIERLKRFLGERTKAPLKGKENPLLPGPVQIRVGRNKDKAVVLAFNRLVQSVGLSRNQAIDIGNALIKNARKLKKGGSDESL